MALKLQSRKSNHENKGGAAPCGRSTGLEGDGPGPAPVRHAAPGGPRWHARFQSWLQCWSMQHTALAQSPRRVTGLANVDEAEPRGLPGQGGSRRETRPSEALWCLSSPAARKQEGKMLTAPVSAVFKTERKNCSKHACTRRRVFAHTCVWRPHVECTPFIALTA